MKTIHRAAAAAVALLLSSSLAACSSGSGGGEADASEQPTDVAPQETPTAPAPVAASPAPQGYQTTTTPTQAISFAVPDTWLVLTSEDLSDDTQLEIAAAALGTTTDQLQTVVDTIDLAGGSPIPDGEFPENLNVIKTSTTAMPNEIALTAVLKAQGHTPGEYSTRQTSIGEAATQTFTTTNDETTVHGTMLFVPNHEGSYATVTITSSTPERTAELADVLLSTLH